MVIKSKIVVHSKSVYSKFLSELMRSFFLSKPTKILHSAFQECPLDVYAAMLKCWPANPMERITFTDLDKELIRPDNLDGHVYQNTDDFGLYENLGYIETLLRENT